MVEKLETEYDLEIEWLGLEIHPDTPDQGISLSEKFSKSNLENMLSNLNSSGSLYGISFGNLELMVNSHNALEAAEFARENGKIKEYHSSLMDAYFRDLKDIGNLQVLSDLGESLGLDKEILINAVKNRTYATTLNNNSNDAHRMKINSTPTFIIEDKYTIVGAQPIEVFRKILDKF